MLHGGGVSHRGGLYDAILVKENHVALAGGHRARRAGGAGRPGGAAFVELEVESLDELDQALAEGVDRILLDNMGPDQLREAVARAAGRATLEASGGITLDTIRAVAETGVDYISVGALTHSARRWTSASCWTRRPQDRERIGDLHRARAEAVDRRRAAASGARRAPLAGRLQQPRRSSTRCRLVAETLWPSAAEYTSRSSEMVNVWGASAKPMLVYDSFARRRSRPASTIGPWSKARRPGGRRPRPSCVGR